MVEETMKKNSQVEKMDSRIVLWVGPMFSSKTSMLINRIQDYQRIKKRVLVIKPELDTRYQRDGGNQIIAFGGPMLSRTGEIVSHVGQRIGALAVEKLSDLPEKLIRDNDVIAIDEAHFFEDLVIQVRIFTRVHQKVVLVAGLDKTYKGIFWPCMNNLIKYCENNNGQIVQMTSICNQCGNEAQFSKLKSKADYESDSVIQIGGEEKYMAACEVHFND